MESNTSGSALHRLSTMWDSVIGTFIRGGPTWNDELRPWVDAYKSSTEATQRIDIAMPEPFNGRLDRMPKAILLALNPGTAFLGTERWRGRYPMEDLQGYQGRFAREILDGDGSYTSWARQPFNWPSMNGGFPHPFVTSRMHFVSNWTSSMVDNDEVVWFDLYPWHSKSWGSIDIRDAHLQHLIDRYVAQPIAALNSPWTFAFGKPWFTVLPSIGFQRLAVLGGPGTKLWSNQTPSRRVGIFENPTTKCRIIAMYHSGGAGPPKSTEVDSLRDLVLTTINPK